jgi:hypothetical protein
MQPGCVVRLRRHRCTEPIITDRITANLPSRDTSAPAAFYERLGFVTDFNDGGWMIMRRGSVELEFFHMPDWKVGFRRASAFTIWTPLFGFSQGGPP